MSNVKLKVQKRASKSKIHFFDLNAFGFHLKFGFKRVLEKFFID
jgi:hypothetical protein